jgi:SAM-dependent MidA family methyltransferase
MHDPHVIAEIERRLAAEGRLTFATVMEIALYHPEGGYYTAHAALGPAGDFVTAPEEHPAFGALLARQAAQCWQAMGAPAVFDVYEMGGGRGALAAAFLAHARAALPDFHAALRYHMIERSPRHRAMQQERLRPSPRRGGGGERSAPSGAEEGGEGWPIDWIDALPDGFTGLLLSNELPDAFPVHRVVLRDGILREMYVVSATAGEGASSLAPRQQETAALPLTWSEGELSTPALQAYFDDLGITLAEGQIAEVNLAAAAWMGEVATRLARGFVLTIDFGHLAKELYKPERRHGSLLAYYRQTVSDDLLDRLGRQDLFAPVDFSTLVRVGRAGGLEPLGLVTQHHFLLDLGLEGWVAALDTLDLPPPARAANRRALVELVRTGENALGDAKVLAQAKGVTAPLDGLTPAMRPVNAARLREVVAPLLT